MRSPPPGILRAAIAFYTVYDILAKYSMRFVVNVTFWTMSENYWEVRSSATPAQCPIFQIVAKVKTAGKLEHFKTLTKNDHSSAHQVNATGHNIKWDHFEILASGKSDY